MIETSSELTRKLSAAVDRMPAFPRSVQRVLELTRDLDCPAKELVMVIEKDPVMTMKLLRILNSAYYSFPKEVTSVNQSVVYLGLNTVKNMALSFAVMGTLPQQNDAGFDFQRYLMHSLTTASLARTLCHRYGDGETSAGDCYIAGLLHDFGKVVFAQFMAEEFQEALALSADRSILLHAAEKQVIGADHTVVGGMLVEKWQFSPQLVANIRNHHSPVAPEDTVQGCLFVADQISKLIISEYREGLAVEELPAALAGRFGADLAGVVDGLGDLSGLENEIRVFARVGKGGNA